MKVKGKRVLKNGVLAGYVRQKDGSWKWRFLKGPSKKKGGEITEGRLNKINKYKNKSNANTELRTKLKNLSKSLEQKHLASPKVFGKHDNKVYKDMYEYLDQLLSEKNTKNEDIYDRFFTEERTNRMKKSIKKWKENKASCETKRCRKQRVASNLINKDLKKIGELLSKPKRKMELALNKLYKRNPYSYPKLSDECYNIVQKTLPRLNEQKVIVYSESTPIETVRDHLSHRVPIYYGGNLFKHKINEISYKKLINGNNIDTNNNILEKIELANKLLNYAVVGEMTINSPKPNVNYHAVHAFGINFEMPTTVDYKLIYKVGYNSKDYTDYTEKVKHLYKNIFKGVEYFNKKYRNNEEYSIIIPAIGMGVFLSSVISRVKKQNFIRINIIELLNVIKNKSINKSKKVHIRFRGDKKRILEIFLEVFKNKNINDNINLTSDNLFDTDVAEKNQYYVNAWDTRSFIGNKLNTDPTIDGMFVAGYRFNKNLINDSYLHNKVIFNSDKAEIVNN